MEEIKIETQTEENKPLTEEQHAMLAFEHFTGLFLQKLNNYSGSRKQIMRAMSHGMVAPLSKEEPRFSYVEEKELFDLYTEANSAKLILMVHGLIKSGALQQLKPLMSVGGLTDSEQQLANMTYGDQKLEGEVTVDELKEANVVSE